MSAKTSRAWWWVLLAAVVALALAIGGTWYAERYARAEAHQQVTDAITSAEGVRTTGLQVQIDSDFFLLDLWRGAIPKVTVDADTLELSDADKTITLNDVHATALNVAPKAPNHAEAVSATGFLEVSELERAIKAEQDVPITLTGGDGVVNVNFQILGVDIALEVEATLGGDGRSVELHAKRVASGSFVTALTKLDDWRFTMPIEQLPPQVKLTDLTVEGERIRLTMEAHYTDLQTTFAPTPKDSPATD